MGKKERGSELPLRTHGADDGIRTRDPRLGKPMLYQLSYIRASRWALYQPPQILTSTQLPKLDGPDELLG